MSHSNAKFEYRGPTNVTIEVTWVESISCELCVSTLSSNFVVLVLHTWALILCYTFGESMLNYAIILSMKGLCAQLQLNTPSKDQLVDVIPRLFL